MLAGAGLSSRSGRANVLEYMQALGGEASYGEPSPGTTVVVRMISRGKTSYGALGARQCAATCLASFD
jgi:hypothetical protein